ncbi:ABC transporter substrate-binding protein [Nocardioides sp. DS6]|uniref:ABC transporter substrate-binding protein n=1 Tax=Nocardioides eburneus TaxID=3231482 RepID=A0ABV3SWM5_9ACTN
MRRIANVNRRARLLGPVAGLLAVALAATACGSSSNTNSNNGEAGVNVGKPQAGGSLTVLEDSGFAGGFASGLDPATNTTGGANLPQMQSIFGGLFLLEADDNGENAKIVPNQAENYSFSDGGKTMTIKLRPGIKFSDGTPMDAKTVVWNMLRDSKSPCSCAPTWQLAKKDPIVAKDNLTVVIHMAQPNGALISNFPISNINWIASKTAFEKMGAAKFKVAPVGAGPFTVVSDQLSSELVLKKNPNYFKSGQPYLDNLTFKSIGGDQPAYQALEAGQADAYEGMSTVPLINQAQKNSKFTITLGPPTSPYVVQLNTMKAPFNNIKAREAIYYATDFSAISKGLFKEDLPVSGSFAGPGGLFYHKSVPGYRNYDLAKAKQLVKELGGLTINLGTTNIYTANQVMTALQTQWEKAGIKVKTNSLQLTGVIQAFTGGNWQAMLQTAGAWDPAAGVGVAFRFASTSPFTGVKDPKLDNLFAQAGATTDSTKRDELYQQAAKYISDKAYAPFGFAFSPANVAAKGVHGPGLTTPIPALAVNTQVLWDEVWREQ